MIDNRLIFLLVVVLFAGCTATRPSKEQSVDYVPKRKALPVLDAKVEAMLRAQPSRSTSFMKDLRMAAITNGPDGSRVTFLDISTTPAKRYFLSVGESKDGIKVLSIDYEKERALLRKGAEQDWLHLGSSGK